MRPLPRRAFLGIVVSWIAIPGCGLQFSRPTTAAGLAEALAKRGIAYERTEPAKMPQGKHFRFDEGIVLIGPELWVEILRIEDDRVFDVARRAGPLLTIAEAVAEREFPGKPELYARDPFLAIVRQEPAPGTVLGALNRVLPDSK